LVNSNPITQFFLFSVFFSLTFIQLPFRGRANSYRFTSLLSNADPLKNGVRAHPKTTTTTTKTSSSTSAT
jgi:hypothetical protein